MSRPRQRTATCWIIVDRHGLYTGQWRTRRDAIRGHVAATGLPTRGADGRVNGFMAVDSFGADRERNIRTGWRYWRARGDRATKATISWKEPAK